MGSTGPLESAFADGLNNSRDNHNPENIKPKCKRCGRAFKRERVEQKYCNARCRNAAVKARLRAKSGDLKPHRRHLVLPHREAVTFGQKKPIKTKAFFDPLAVNFQAPVIDFLQRGAELLSLVVYGRNPEISAELSPTAAQW